jgi:glycolate oxidase FAD binding subunit
MAATSTDYYRPTNAEDVLALVQAAIANSTPMEVIGGGSKRGIGRPLQTDTTLSTSQMTGITLYEPEELVLSARAGTPMEEIEAALLSNNQQLAFEPPSLAGLLGTDQVATIGGVISCNLSGSKRLKNGAARDHILGVHVVSGRGEIFKSGGRVVKNVTGYDLSKLMTGAYGTLGILTDITVKVLPKAETETTLVIGGLTDEQAITAMSTAVGSTNDLSAAAHCPLQAAQSLGFDQALTLLRLEGFGASLTYRAAELRSLLSEYGAVDKLVEPQSGEIWQLLREVQPFWGQDTAVWRVSVTPGVAHRVIEQISRHIDVAHFYDWQGGLIWLSAEEGNSAQAAIIRQTVTKHGGHATLIRASGACRLQTPVFHPQSEGLVALSQRLKDQFDPHHILNPLKMDRW